MSAGPGRLVFSVGDYSADLYAAGLVRHLRRLRPGLEFAALGGDALAAAGVELLYPLARDPVMGLGEAARGLGRLRAARGALAAELRRRPPAAVVLVDYGGFNLAAARLVRALAPGTKVIWYIPPKLWAWGGWRAARLRRDLDLALCILPFEPGWLAERGVTAAYAGNPLPAILDAEPADPGFDAKYRLDPARPGLLLLPGSRRQEWERLLPPMLAAAARFSARHPEAAVWLAPAPGLDGEWFRAQLARSPVPVTVMPERYQAMRRARAALAASGTVTLETGLLGLPTAIAYRLAPLTWLAAKALVGVRFAGLANLLLDRAVQPELLQGDCTPERLAAAAEALWADDGKRRAAAVAAELRERLGPADGLAWAAEQIGDALAAR